MSETFDHFHFAPSLLEGLQAMGFNKPTPIQAQAIPFILANKDLIACAQTGTGKTAAYLLPLIHKLASNPQDSINTLIIAPTRELAIQIDEALQGFAYFTPVSSLAIYGGNDGFSFEQEKKALTLGANFIIATPGRLIAHLNMGYVKFGAIEHLVLDEADRMLDMGFSQDINKIIGYLPKERQTLLFSATMPHKIRELAKAILKEPEQINIALSKPAEGVNQGAYMVYPAQKVQLLLGLIKEKNPESAIVFSSTKDKVKQLEKELLKLNMNIAAIHSDLEQDQRNKVMLDFKGKKIQTIVATDILSRGIDIDSISLVINYDVPHDAEDYVHRVGRTARAASTGEAITFVTPEDQHRFKRIEDHIGSSVKQLPLPTELGEGPVYDPESKPEKKGFVGPKGKGGADGKRSGGKGFTGKGFKGKNFKPRNGGSHSSGLNSSNNNPSGSNSPA